MSAPEQLVEITPAMVLAGVTALREETFGIQHEELVTLVYAAMEYQRRRDCASATKVLR